MIDTIRKRRSIRTYADKSLEADLRQKIEAILADPGTGFFGHTANFALIEKAQAQQDEKVRLGTYGFIKGARHFIAGALEHGEKAEVDYGYLMERIVLEMTRLGLGTCWLGGTFSRREYAQILHLDDRSWVPAILSLGYAADRKGTVEKLVRWGAGADHRKPWSELFFDGDFTRPLAPDVAGPFAEALEMVRIGPSASNKQPWRIVKDGDTLHLYLVRTPGYYGKYLPSTDLQMIDMGIAMQHLEAAAEALGLNGHWETVATGFDTRGAEYIVTWTTEAADEGLAGKRP
jgi:nitroreductase